LWKHPLVTCGTCCFVVAIFFKTWCCCWFKNVIGSVLFGAKFLDKLYVKILKCKEIMLGLWYHDDVWSILWGCDLIWCNYMMSWCMFDLVMRCCMYVYTYVMGQYEFSDNCKARMVLLPKGLYRVRVNEFFSTISLWHELSKVLLPKALSSG